MFFFFCAGVFVVEIKIFIQSKIFFGGSSESWCCCFYWPRLEKNFGFDLLTLWKKKCFVGCVMNKFHKEKNFRWIELVSIGTLFGSVEMPVQQCARAQNCLLRHYSASHFRCVTAWSGAQCTQHHVPPEPSQLAAARKPELQPIVDVHLCRASPERKGQNQTRHIWVKAVLVYINT